MYYSRRYWFLPHAVFGEDDNAPAERVPIEELLAADEYKEGEVLAVMKPSSSVFSDQGEELSQISAESLKETVKAAKEADLPQAEIAEERIETGSETYTVRLITDHSRTTEELITDLYRNSVTIESKNQSMNCLMTLWLLLKSSGN